MRIRRIIGGMILGGIAVLLPSCSSAPPGPDLVNASCTCIDGCAGGLQIPLPGSVCTKASVPETFKEALKVLCDGKNTKSIGLTCTVHSCKPNDGPQVIPGGCPENNGKFKTGDFGQNLANAVAPSKVVVSGGDIHEFTITPQSFVVNTTQEGSTLTFTFLKGTLGTTTFTSGGIFGAGSHRIEDGMLYGALFSTALQPDGKYVLPPDANFIITGSLDGNRVSLTLSNLNLSGVYDETAGLFTLAGAVKAVGADININVDLVFRFDNRPPRAAAGPDQVVECSASDQTGTVSLSGAASFDPDGNDDIALFTWYLDGEEAATGPAVDVPASLGAHEVKLVVADQKGSFGGDALAVTVGDTRPPSIGIVQPKPIPYTHSDTIVLDYDVTDACTGVDSFTPRMDGADTVGGHGLRSGQAIHLLTELALGKHTFTVTAVDKQGNNSSASVAFTIVVTPESIEEAVHQFVASGAITHDGNFLLGKLENAAKHYHAKNCRPASNVYQAFIQTVGAQRGKTIDPGAADILIADAQFLMDHCPE